MKMLQYLALASLLPLQGVSAHVSGSARQASNWQLVPAKTLVARGGPYRVTANLRKLEGAGADQLLGWGAKDPATGAGDKNEGIGSFQVFRSGHRVQVPRSAVADLGNVHYLRIIKAGAKYIIRIEGGDASTGYRASLWLKGDRVIKRRVESGEFPEQDYEETQYVVLPIKD